MSRTILLVRSDARGALAVLCALAGFGRIVWARTLLQAMDHLGDGPRGVDPAIGVVLCDLQLSDSHGIRTLERLRARSPGLPIFLLGDRRAAPGDVPTDAFDHGVALAIGGADPAAVLFEANERAQVTLDAIADGVISTDADGLVTYCNPCREARRLVRRRSRRSSVRRDLPPDRGEESPPGAGPYGGGDAG